MIMVDMSGMMTRSGMILSEDKLAEKYFCNFINSVCYAKKERCDNYCLRTNPFWVSLQNMSGGA
jgi:hypothetical protein